MRILTTIVAAAVVLCGMVGCTPKDSERCGDGYYYDAGNCFQIGGEDTGEDCGDAGVDAGPSPGMGTECESDVDCQDFEADYCLLNPLSPDDPGVCTTTACTLEPDSCPCPWFCCHLPEYTGMPDVCLPPEAVEDTGAYCE